MAGCKKIFFPPGGPPAVLQQEALASYESAEFHVYRSATACFRACIARLRIYRPSRRERVMPCKMPVAFVCAIADVNVHGLVVAVARQGASAEEGALCRLRI